MTSIEEDLADVTSRAALEYGYLILANKPIATTIRSISTRYPNHND